MRLIDKGVINLEELYAQKRAEIDNAEHEAAEELKRRAEEDKKIQEAKMHNESKKELIDNPEKEETAKESDKKGAEE